MPLTTGAIHIKDKMTPTQTQTNNQTTFASKVKQTFPNKNQAIIMNTVDDIEIFEYVKAVGDIIGPNNIHFASKISNNRICIYLANKTLVDQIITSHPNININEQQIIIRRLITPAIRITISNVCPSIPHEVLQNIFQEKGINMVSPINFLRAGLKNDEYAHILSFKRQVYVSATSNELPDSILITYEDTNYRIFLSGENIRCHKCNETGHLSSKCPKTNNENQEKDSNQNENKKRPAPVIENSDSETEKSQNENDISVSQIDIDEQNTQISNSDEIEPKIKKTKKATRSDSPGANIPIETLLEPLKQEMNDHPEKYILTYDNLKNLMENIQGSIEQVQITKEYVNDFPALHKTLEDLKPLLTHRSIKGRFTRLQNKLTGLTTQQKTTLAKTQQ